MAEVDINHILYFDLTELTWNVVTEDLSALTFSEEQREGGGEADVWQTGQTGQTGEAGQTGLQGLEVLELGELGELGQLGERGGTGGSTWRRHGVWLGARPGQTWVGQGLEGVRREVGTDGLLAVQAGVGRAGQTRQDGQPRHLGGRGGGRLQQSRPRGHQGGAQSSLGVVAPSSATARQAGRHQEGVEQAQVLSHLLHPPDLNKRQITHQNISLSLSLSGSYLSLLLCVSKFHHKRGGGSLTIEYRK